MNTLKSVIVLAVLGIVGYGLYVGLNNGFQFDSSPQATPDWLKAEMGEAPPTEPSVELGAASPPGSPEQGPPRLSLSGGTSSPATYEQTAAPAHPQGSSPPTTSPPVFDASGAPSQGPITQHSTEITAPRYPKVSSAVATYPGGATTAPGGPTMPTGGSGATNVALNATTNSDAAGSRYPQLQNETPSLPRLPAAPTQPARADTGSSTNSAYAAPSSLVAKAAPPSATVTPAPTTAAAKANPFETAMAKARTQLDQGKLAEALSQLSIWHQDPNLSGAQQQQLAALLDQVAGTVIYSRKHLLQPAYRVQAGDQLADIATRYNVPPGLLAKINGVTSGSLTPGQELKVVRGPFNAIVNSTTSELTLWVEGRYAGRFTVTMGPEFRDVSGPFVVKEKVRQHFDNNGQPRIELEPGYRTASLPQDAPKIGIVGMQNPSAGRPGSIGVSPRDAGDLFDILSTGSKVSIRR